jgi:hypothetical protein
MVSLSQAVRPLLLAGIASIVFAATACGDDDPKLKVVNISPDKGDSDGGTYVVIKGNRFIKDGPRNAKVYFGSRQGSIVRFQSDSELIVQAPGGKIDEVVDVLVIFDPGGQLTIKKAFKFVDKNDNGPSVDDLDTSGRSQKKK